MRWTERLPSGLLAFLLVGATAAAVHYLVALVLHDLLGVPAGWANPLAFACAFPVSYLGHRELTFKGIQVPHRQALPRFLSVALTSFAANQLLLLALLRWTPVPFWLALGFTLVAVAVGTYLLSRFWAFAEREQA